MVGAGAGAVCSPRALTVNPARVHMCTCDPQFGDYFPPSDNKCPFGPNYGLFTYKYICSLEDAPEEEWALDRIRKFRAKNGCTCL